MNSIVIGSGFGGIAAALRLRAKGHEVTIIEKQPDLGGRARVFKKNGFTFDGGPTVITAPYLINELFDLFKKDPKNYIKLTPLKIWYQFIFEDKTKFDYLLIVLCLIFFENYQVMSLLQFLIFHFHQFHFLYQRSFYPTSL